MTTNQKIYALLIAGTLIVAAIWALAAMDPGTCSATYPC